MKVDEVGNPFEGSFTHEFLTIDHHSGLALKDRDIVLNGRFINNKWFYVFENIHDSGMKIVGETSTNLPKNVPKIKEAIPHRIDHHTQKQQKTRKENLEVENLSNFSIKHLTPNVKMTEIFLKKPFFFSSTKWANKSFYKSKDGVDKGKRSKAFDASPKTHFDVFFFYWCKIFQELF